MGSILQIWKFFFQSVGIFSSLGAIKFSFFGHFCISQIHLLLHNQSPSFSGNSFPGQFPSFSLFSFSSIPSIHISTCLCNHKSPGGSIVPLAQAGGATNDTELMYTKLRTDSMDLSQLT